MPTSPGVVPALLLAVILVVSGVAKARDLRTTIQAFLTLRLPSWTRRAGGPIILPWAEIALAVALILLPGPWNLIAGVMAVLLFAAYLVIIARALTFSEPVTCGCLGRLGLGTVSRFTLGRNIVLFALAGLTLWDATRGMSVMGRLLDFGTATWWWLVMTAVALVLGGLVTHQTPDQLPGAPDPATPAPERAAAPASSRAPSSQLVPAGATADGEYIRMHIPFGTLFKPGGDAVGLRDLAQSSPALLLFVNPGCGSCVMVMQGLDGFQERAPEVTPYLVFAEPTMADDPHVPEGVEWLADRDWAVATAFGAGHPSGVLLGADGLTAGGPVLGYPAVSEFMDDIVAELEEHREAAAPHQA